MSKKMMKRSLVLGALMAFVITGSAMAAPYLELEDDESYNDSIQNWAPTDVVEIKLNDYGLTIDTSGRGIAIGEWGYKVYGSEKSVLTINSGDSGLSNFGSIDVGTLDINASGGHAIEAGSTTKINADTITINVQGGNGLFLTPDASGKTLDVDFDNSLSITAVGSANGICSKGNGGAIFVNGARGSSLTIDTSESTGYAVYAVNNSKIYLNTALDDKKNLVYSGGAQTTIEGDILVEDASEVNVGLKGSESSLTGTITTGENATSNLILQSANWYLTGDSTVTKLTGSGYNVKGDHVLNLKGSLGNSGTVDVKELNIKTESNGISVYGDMTVTADKIIIDGSKTSAVYTEYPTNKDTTASNLIINVKNELEITGSGHGFNSGTSNAGSSIVVNGKDANIYVNVGENAIVTRGGENGSINITGKIVTLESTGTGDSVGNNAKGHGIYAQGVNSDISVEATESLTVTAVSGKHAIYADSNGSSITVDGGAKTTVNGMIGIAKGTEDTVFSVTGEDIVVTANEDDTDAIAIAGATNKLSIGDSETNTITINGGSDSGMFVNYGASANLVANDTITVNGDQYGLWVQGQNQDAIVDLEAKTIEVTGIFTTGGAVVNLDGNTNITATEGRDAIAIRGGAVNNINVGEDGESLGNTVKIDGNINFTTGDKSGKDAIDAQVNIALDGEGSYLKGNIIKTVEYQDEQGNTVVLDEDKQKVTGMTLGLSNGATWYVTDKSFVNTLNADKGIISFAADNAHVDIDAGSGSVILTEKDKTADDLHTVEQLNTVAEKFGVAADAKEKIDATVVMAQGKVKGETTGVVSYEDTVGDDGYYHGFVAKDDVTEKVNTENQSIGEAGVSLKLHWRSHMNDMNKRMGELRNANGEHGVWTRMVRGESEYEGTKAQYNQYQLGYDEKLSVDKRWTVGAAVTFAEGDANYGSGSTDDKSTAFAIYGSKLNDDGTFVDLIARYAHLESDLEDAYSGKGDYSTSGMSVSAEFGKRIQQGNGLWIEPQVELTYGTVDSAEFQLEGKTVHVGDMDSLIGRVGFSLGKDIKQGNVYARASYLYDFDGETESVFSDASDSRTIAEDLGGGWWEVGVGANINLSKATYIYADIEKTFGGEVDTNWQWNLGVRYSF